MKNKLYFYKLKSYEVYDGDTLRNVFIDVGFDISYFNNIRLFGVDCPEILSNNPEEVRLGIKAKNFVVDFLSGGDVYIRSLSKDKYGRVLAEIINHEGKQLYFQLIKNGLAVYYSGGSRVNWSKILSNPKYVEGEEIKFLEIVVDINDSSHKELQHLIGVGSVIAQRIIDNRPYKSIHDLIRVPGIGENTIQNIINQNKVIV